MTLGASPFSPPSAADNGAPPHSPGIIPPSDSTSAHHHLEPSSKSSSHSCSSNDPNFSCADCNNSRKYLLDTALGKRPHPLPPEEEETTPFYSHTAAATNDASLSPQSSASTTHHSKQFHSPQFMQGNVTTENNRSASTQNSHLTTASTTTDARCFSPKDSNSEEIDSTQQLSRKQNISISTETAAAVESTIAADAAPSPSTPTTPVTPQFPIEIFYEIFWFLSFVQILPLSQVSKLWYYVTHTDVFLRHYVDRLPGAYVQYCKRQMYDSLRILREWPFQSFYHLDNFRGASNSQDPHSLWRMKWYIHLSGLFKGHIVPPNSRTKPLSESDIERKKKSQFIKCLWNKEQMRRLVDGKRYVNDIVLVEGCVTDITYSGVNNHFATVSLKVDRVRGQEKNLLYHVRYFISLLGILFGFFGSVFVICLVGQLATLGLLALYCFKSFLATSKFGCLFSVRYLRSQRDRVYAAKEKFLGITATGWDTLISHLATVNMLLSVIAEEKWRLLVQRIQDINCSVYGVYDASETILNDFKHRLIVEKEEILRKINSSIPHDSGDAFSAAFMKISREAQGIVKTLEESGEYVIDELME